MQLLSKDNQIDVYGYCLTLNNARQGLVESVEQYQFIYECLAEAVLCDVRPIEMHELKDRSSMYKAKKDRQKMEGQDTHENKVTQRWLHIASLFTIYNKIWPEPLSEVIYS